MLCLICAAAEVLLALLHQVFAPLPSAAALSLKMALVAAALMLAAIFTVGAEASVDFISFQF